MIPASRKIVVPASERWYHTGFNVERGERYRFTVPPGQRWHDWYIPSGPEGYADKLVNRLTRPLLRVKSLNGVPIRFFALIGTVGEDLATAFVIGGGCEWIATASGELVCFANDVGFAYWNNRGTMTFTVENVSNPDVPARVPPPVRVV
jgi:hypothetical protein